MQSSILDLLHPDCGTREIAVTDLRIGVKPSPSHNGGNPINVDNMVNGDAGWYWRAHVFALLINLLPKNVKSKFYLGHIISRHPCQRGQKGWMDPVERASPRPAPCNEKGPLRGFRRGPWKGEAGGALLSRALERSIIAAGDLNGRVRDGNGCVLPAGAASQNGRQPNPDANRGTPLAPERFSCPFPGRDVSRRGKGRRPGRTAYQKRYAEALAGLAHPPCPPGGLPGAFRALRRGTARLRGGLALRCLQRLSLRGVATRRCP